MSMNLQGADGFWEYYGAMAWGDGFWDGLESEFLPVLRFGKKVTSQLRELWEREGLEWQPLPWYPEAVVWPEGVAKGTTLPGYEEHLFYPMNASSLVPVLALDPQPGEKILDACAAPGGKALMMADMLEASGGIECVSDLVANDLSGARRQRMREIFGDYGYGADGPEVWGRKAEIIFKTNAHAFDKILLDAPCSSECHVYQSPKHLQQWSYSRVKQLKSRQYALLSGLWRALKPGGLLIYSTCAMTPEENEAVIGRFLKKYADAKLVELGLTSVPGEGGMPGDYVTDFDLEKVHRILPHKHGLAPMFVAGVRKVA